MDTVRLLTRYTLFPLTLGISLAAAYWAKGSGFSPASVMGLTAFIAISCVASGELFLPFNKEWSKSRGDVKTDLLHSLLSSFLGREVFKFLWLVPLLPLAARFSQSSPVAIWPSTGH